MKKEHRSKKLRFNWAAVGAVVLILLLLGWFLIVDADGDPNNGMILPFATLL